MLRQFLVGVGVSLINIAIHAVIMTMVVQVARAMGSKRQPHSSLVLIVVMIPTISVLMAAHTIEVFVWALAYLIFGAAPKGADLVYFAFVNYATLGYGDVLPVERWRLLGPLTAMNGIPQSYSRSYEEPWCAPSISKADWNLILLCPVATSATWTSKLNAMITKELGAGMGEVGIIAIAGVLLGIMAGALLVYFLPWVARAQLALCHTMVPQEGQ
jgi:hypothetical protein